MIDGKKLYQISKFQSHPGGPFRTIEIEHRNVKFRKYLLAGPTEMQIDGEWVLGERSHDLIQFYADPGGLRTVRSEDIIAIGEPNEKFL